MVFEIKEINTFLSMLQDNNLSDNTYLSSEYLSTLCDYHKPDEGKFLCFVVKNDEDQVVGFLPLVKRKLDHVILGFRYSNYLGYICKDSDVLYVDLEICDYIKRYHRSMVITYYDINDSNVLFTILENDKRAKHSFLYNCPFCDTTDSFDIVFSRQISKAKKRTELRKFRKKLDLLGEVKILDVDNADSWEEGKEYFRQIYKVHKERFSGVYIPKELSLSCNQDYYTELFENLVKGGRAYISIMLLDKQVISFVYSVVSNGIIMDWMPAFDPAFTKYNLGTVHLMHILEYACNNEKYLKFDFSKGDGTYKDRWSNGITKNYMFIRRFSASPFAVLRKSIIFFVYSIKGYLREKGILRIIKGVIGRNTSLKDKAIDEKHFTFAVDNEDIEKDGFIMFSYPLIINESVETRKEVLDRIYNGETIVMKKTS